MQSLRPSLCDHQPTSADFQQDVVLGLRAEPKHLPCKYFYDQRGCELFDQICELDEYYLTRTELAIMEQFADEMAYVLGRNCVLIEYGSGSSVKTRILLEAMDDLGAYIPVDIARDHLQQTATRLLKRYPWLRVWPVCADFSVPFELPDSCDDSLRRVVYFPGSTIGNFERAARRDLLTSIATLCGPQGGLLIGVDLEKDEAILNAAYNDAQGVTADFNLNLLRHINRELDADFDLPEFEHRAFYNPENARVEMHLVSLSEQWVTVGEERFKFEPGESVRTEYSHKFTPQRVTALAAHAGFRLRHCWTDEDELFAVLYLDLP